MSSTPLEIAGQLFAAIEAKSVDAVAALYDERIEVWHNFTNVVQSKADNLRVLAGLIRSAQTIRYDIIERHQVGGSRIVQRHNLECVTLRGVNVTLPACIFLTIEHGLIRRIDEYLDSAQTQSLRAQA